MSQFFVTSTNIHSGIIKITDKKEINHIVRVRRLKEGDRIGIFDEKKNSYKGVIEKIEDGEIIVKKIGTHPIFLNLKQKIGCVPIFSLTIACALPKKAKFDYIVEKLTELGVSHIIPMITNRTIVKLSPEKAKDRVVRFRKIAVEAAKQSNNPNIPIIDEITDFKDIFSRGVSRYAHFDLIIIPTLVETQNFASLQEILKNPPERLADSPAAKVLVLIGPEGDFSPEEIDFAKKFGAKPVTLSERILKVDTACIYVASIINNFQ